MNEIKHISDRLDFGLYEGIGFYPNFQKDMKSLLDEITRLQSELADRDARIKELEGRLKPIEEAHKYGLCAFPSALTEEELHKQYGIMWQAIKQAKGE